MSRICVSLAEKELPEIISVLQNIEFSEIRLDISRINESEIHKLFSLPKKFIATCREGFYNDTERMGRLKKAIESGAAYVDIETEASPEYQKELYSYAKKYNCKVIISYHNFDTTPEIQNIEKIISICKEQGADIVKLVTTANTEAESSRILSLYQNHNNLIAFAMGNKGKITRVASLFLGAPFSYAALSEDKIVAGGQLAYNKMQKIIDLIDL